MDTQFKGNFLYDEVLPKVELINWFVLSAGLMLRGFFLLPGGDTLLIVGLGGLAIVYFLQAFEPSYADITDDFVSNGATNTAPPDDDFISLLARQLLAFGSALTFLGILFKLLFGAARPLCCQPALGCCC
jgi:hypothetical protein